MHLPPRNYDIGSCLVFKSHVTRRPRDLHVVNTKSCLEILFISSGDLSEILTVFKVFCKEIQHVAPLSCLNCVC